MIQEESLVERSAELGEWFLSELQKISHADVKEIRGRGLLAGIELNVRARPYCERLAELGILCKGAHDKVLRIAPPLVIKKAGLEWAAGQLRQPFQT